MKCQICREVALRLSQGHLEDTPRVQAARAYLLEMVFMGRMKGMHKAHGGTRGAKRPPKTEN